MPPGTAARADDLVSIVTPALNAAATLGRTLSSVRAQRHRHWELVVVDDGSTDGTRDLVERAATDDPRIRLVRQDHGGASAARNAGIRAARGHYLLFLDADDAIAPDHLASLVALHAARPEAGLVFSDAMKCFADGTAKRFYCGYLAESPFEVLAEYCAPVIHGVLLRTELARAVGGFDESLVTCEDWDLWQRVARTGAPFLGTDEPTAMWHVTERSLSSNVDQMTLDGRRVNSQAYAADPRVPDPAPEYAHGLAGERSEAPVTFLGWCIGQRIANGEPSEPGFGLEDSPHDFRASARAFAEAVAQGIASRTGERRTLETYLGAREELVRAAEGWCASRGAPALGPRLAVLLDEEMLMVAELERACALPHAHGVRIDLSRHIDDVPVPAGVGSLVVQFVIGEQTVSKTVLPVFDGEVAAGELFGAVAEGLRLKRFVRTQSVRMLSRPSSWGGLAPAAALFARRLARVARSGHRGRTALRQALRAAAIDAAGRFFSHRAPPQRSYASIVGRVRAACAPAEPAGHGGAIARTSLLQHEPTVEYEVANPSAYWESIFARADPWAYDSDYERRKYERTLELLGGRTFDTGLELACAEGHFTRMLAPSVGSLLAADISVAALERAAERCADLPAVSHLRLDFFNEPIPGTYDLIVCSEVLYYAGENGTLERVLANIANALKPGGTFVHAHAFVLYDDPSRTGFDWEGQYGAERVSRRARELPGLVRTDAIETELYRIEAYTKTHAGGGHVEPRRVPLDSRLDDELAGMIVWGGAGATRADVWEETTTSVPILMLHRVADDAPPGLGRYTLSPARLEAILRELRRLGYHSVSLQELDAHMSARRPFRGRPIVITFDDGYADLPRETWSIVRRNGFSAVVFAVTGLMGRTSEWDAHLGPTSPLMSVEELRRMAAEGCEFGSHLASHRSLDLMDNEEVLREAIGSRLQLESWLGEAPIAVAPPYGQVTDLSCRLLAAAGYRLVFTTEHGIASVFDSGFDLPRIEVTGLDDHRTVLGKLRAPGTRAPLADPIDVEPA